MSTLQRKKETKLKWNSIRFDNVRKIDSNNKIIINNNWVICMRCVVLCLYCMHNLIDCVCPCLFILAIDFDFYSISIVILLHFWVFNSIHFIILSGYVRSYENICFVSLSQAPATRATCIWLDQTIVSISNFILFLTSLAVDCCSLCRLCGKLLRCTQCVYLRNEDWRCSISINIHLWNNPSMVLNETRSHHHHQINMNVNSVRWACHISNEATREILNDTKMTIIIQPQSLRIRIRCVILND